MAADARPIARLLHATTRAPLLQRAGSRSHALLVRVTRGRVLGRWLGAPVLVLETTGRRTGRRRVTPVVYLPHPDGFAVTPLNAGARSVPAWWQNLLAAGRATVVVAGRRFEVAPRVADARERDELWAQMARLTPVIDDFRRLAGREIPVAVLERQRGL